MVGEDKSIRTTSSGFVRLVDSMGDDIRVVEAARVSYGQGSKGEAQDKRLINYLMRHGHTSPFEQVEFTFHVKAPIAIARQWLRHRTANVNEISGRYVELEDSWYTPAQFRKQARVNKQASEGTFSEVENQELLEAYEDSNTAAYATYQHMLKTGVAREMSRFVLPQSMHTEFYWKIDAHNLFHFLRLRLGDDAQLEIREFARAMLDIIRPIIPWSVAAYEEYVLNAVTLSRTEVKMLDELLSYLSEDYSHSVGRFKDSAHGLLGGTFSERDINAFVKKLSR